LIKAAAHSGSPTLAGSQGRKAARSAAISSAAASAASRYWPASRGETLRALALLLYPSMTSSGAKVTGAVKGRRRRASRVC
jgi:hypothetical protein